MRHSTGHNSFLCSQYLKYIACDGNEFLHIILAYISHILIKQVGTYSYDLFSYQYVSMLSYVPKCMLTFTYDTRGTSAWTSEKQNRKDYIFFKVIQTDLHLTNKL